MRLLTRALANLLEKQNIEKSLISFTSSLVNAALTAFVIITALGQLGIQTTSFVAIIGAAGLAIGLALQGSLSNFAAGVLMIIFRPIKVGDFIEAAGTAGTVDDIQIFSTTLRTPDNKLIIVPNASITGGNIVNYSSKATRRIDLEFNICHEADLEKTKAVFTRIMNEDERILKDPAPVVAIKALTDSAVVFVLRPWVNTSDFADASFALTEKVKTTLQAEGISMSWQLNPIYGKKSAQTSALAC
ncbi:MAG TPA: mechanosensitive ion channel domain-containing protein [Pseudomonadales bacterium]|nr:mechanosensitive ion channel domain-containing protein [Pseudomonadales bacterium]